MVVKDKKQIAHMPPSFTATTANDHNDESRGPPQQQRGDWCGTGTGSTSSSVMSSMMGFAGPIMACWKPDVNDYSCGAPTFSPKSSLKKRGGPPHSPTSPTNPPSLVPSPLVAYPTPPHPYQTTSSSSAPAAVSPAPSSPPQSPLEQAARKHQQLTNIPKPHSNDVLCGRGGSSNRHIGNLNFRTLVAANKEMYVTLTKKQKMLVARAIVDKVHGQEPPGRFLQKDTQSGLWFDIGLPRSLEKTSQALREKTSDKDKSGANNNAENDEARSDTSSGVSSPPRKSSSPEASPPSTPGSNTPTLVTSSSSKSRKNVKAPPIVVPSHLESQFNPRQIPRYNQGHPPPPPPPPSSMMGWNGYGPPPPPPGPPSHYSRPFPPHLPPPIPPMTHSRPPSHYHQHPPHHGAPIPPHQPPYHRNGGPSHPHSPVSDSSVNHLNASSHPTPPPPPQSSSGVRSPHSPPPSMPVTPTPPHYHHRPSGPPQAGHSPGGPPLLPPNMQRVNYPPNTGPPPPQPPVVHHHHHHHYGPAVTKDGKPMPRHVVTTSPENPFSDSTIVGAKGSRRPSNNMGVGPQKTVYLNPPSRDDSSASGKTDQKTKTVYLNAPPRDDASKASTGKAEQTTKTVYLNPPPRDDASMSPSRRHSMKKQRRGSPPRPKATADESSPCLSQDVKKRLSLEESSISPPTIIRKKNIASPSSVLQTKARRVVTETNKDGLEGLAALSNAALLMIDDKTKDQ